MGEAGGNTQFRQINLQWAHLHSSPCLSFEHTHPHTHTYMRLVEFKFPIILPDLLPSLLQLTRQRCQKLKLKIVFQASHIAVLFMLHTARPVSLHHSVIFWRLSHPGTCCRWNLKGKITKFIKCWVWGSLFHFRCSEQSDINSQNQVKITC